MPRSPYVFDGEDDPFRRGWIKRAACADLSPDDFMKRDTESLTNFMQRVSGDSESLSCPTDCPVMMECAIDALENADVEVIRAGVYLHPQQSKAKFKESRSRLEEVAGLFAHSG